jgi:hypothetical protein
MEHNPQASCSDRTKRPTDAHHALERYAFRRHHVDIDAASSQRRGDLEADEACANYHDVFGRSRLLDDGPAVGE